MDKIHFDEEKIKEYAKIQTNLCLLEPNSDEEAIEQLIKQIPSNYLSQKDDLLMICQLFAQYARNYLTTTRGNVVKLLERILTPIKTYLQNESTFFWKIFGGLFYFKLWFYQEGLITFEEILSSSINDDTPLAKEYFLPEIIENAPEIFDKEIKYHITCPYSTEYIQNFKELRKKHFKWLRDCCDCHDPSYREIEENQLRLSIKTDDVDTFQKILSNLGMSVNSKIRESTLENYQRYSDEISLISFAISFNSIKIIKFLIMNNVEFHDEDDFSAVLTHNNEIIHLVESNMVDTFKVFSLIDSIGSWNFDMVEYSIENYDFDYIEKSDIDSELDDKVLNLFNQTVVSKNFVFFESYLLPFLKKNNSLVDRNINVFVLRTYSDYSCFFLKPLLEHPLFDINYVAKDDDDCNSYLSRSIYYHNLRAVEIFVKYTNFDINKFVFNDYTAFQMACVLFPNTKILKLISDFPGFNINVEDNADNLTAFDLAVGNGSFISIEFILQNFENFNSNPLILLFFKCILCDNLYSLKLILKYAIYKCKFEPNEIIVHFKKAFSKYEDYKESHAETLKSLIHEITGNNNDN